MEFQSAQSQSWTKRVELIDVLTEISTCNLVEEWHWNRRNWKQTNARKTQLKIESKLNLPNHSSNTISMLIIIELKSRTKLWSVSSNIPHNYLFTDEVDSWSKRNEGYSANSVGMFASGVDERSSQDSSGCVRREDWHISISHRLIAVFTMTENEKNKFSHLLPVFLEANIQFYCFVTVRYLSVWCAHELELFVYKVRQILLFSSLAGNGMEETNEPPIIKTLRGRKDTLIRKTNTHCGK